MGRISTYIEFSKMRHLAKKVWPYKIKVENFEPIAHSEFINSHPNIKTFAISRNTQWGHNKYDVYFQKESDAILYKLCV